MTALARAILLAAALSWPLQPLDDAVQGWMRSHQEPSAHQAMDFVSSKARWVLIGAAALGLLSGAAGRAFVSELAVVLVPVNLLVEGLKWTVARTRPDGDTHRRNSSFPSSHAANAFALAAVLTRCWRRSAVPAWLAAGVVAFSRLYLDRHWLSDVLASALIALASAWLAAWIFKRRQERTDPSLMT